MWRCAHERIAPIYCVAIQASIVIAAAGLSLPCTFVYSQADTKFCMPPACQWHGRSTAAQAKCMQACLRLVTLLLQPPLLLLVMEYFEGGSLAAALADPHTRPLLRWEQR